MGHLKSNPGAPAGVWIDINFPPNFFDYLKPRIYLLD